MERNKTIVRFSNNLKIFTGNAWTIFSYCDRRTDEIDLYEYEVNFR